MTSPVSMNKLLAEVDRLGNELAGLLFIGRVVSYDARNGLAQIESLNYNYGSPLVIDNVAVLNHGDTFIDYPVHQSPEQSTSSNHDWNANIDDLVLVLRVSDQIYVMVGTVNALKNIKEVSEPGN